MENTIKELDSMEELTEEEKIQRDYDKKLREMKISRTRANVLRLQITEAYSILENIRFDYLGDTAFREKIVRSKQALESAINDFLLNDTYWLERIKTHENMTVEEYTRGKEDCSWEQGYGGK